MHFRVLQNKQITNSQSVLPTCKISTTYEFQLS